MIASFKSKALEDLVIGKSTLVDVSATLQQDVIDILRVLDNALTLEQAIEILELTHYVSIFNSDLAVVITINNFETFGNVTATFYEHAFYDVDLMIFL